MLESRFLLVEEKNYLAKKLVKDFVLNVEKELLVKNAPIVINLKNNLCLE